MFYYRYRSSTEVNFKELLYDEMYFSSSAECNDPFDSKTYSEFTKEKEKWKNLLMLSWRYSESFLRNVDVDMVAEILSNNCPLPYDLVLSNDFEKLLADTLIKSTNPENRDMGILFEAARRFIDTVHLYKMQTSYFVSFSKINSEPLMWSHYSAKHEGYCLIFKSIGGQLKQCPARIKKAIHRETPNGFAPSMGYGIPESFPFQDVDYVPEVKPLNAFQCFPQSVAGAIPSEEDRLKLCSDQFGQYLQKHISWRYEQESRLIMLQPLPWILGGRFDYSVQERLLHYEPTQLVGLIFGTRTSTDNRLRLMEIIKERQERIARSVGYKRVIFDFIIFDAKLAYDAREVKINPVEILGLVKTSKPGDHDFSRRYSEWENGYGLCFDGNACSAVCIKS